jgi:ribosomal protein S27AE
MSRVFDKLLEEKLNSTELFEIVDNSISAADVVRKLGYAVKGLLTSKVISFLTANEIDYSHFRINGSKKPGYIHKLCPVCANEFITYEKDNNTTCGYSCANTYFRSGTNNPNYTGSLTNRISGRNYREVAYSTYGKVCNRCSYSNILALEVHHKDRNRENNSLDNLEVLCSNCHAIEHKSK